MGRGSVGLGPGPFVVATSCRAPPKPSDRAEPASTGLAAVGDEHREEAGASGRDIKSKAGGDAEELRALVDDDEHV